MRETAKTFTTGLMESVTLYWNKFLLALPRIIMFWANTFDYRKGVLQIKSEVITKVKEALETKGFSLPADIQEIKLYDKKEPLPINILNIKDVAKRLE